MTGSKQPPVWLSTAATEAMRICATHGLDGPVVITGGRGEVDCVTYGGETWAHIDGGWTLYEREVPNG